jgi:hypothetical protein
LFFSFSTWYSRRRSSSLKNEMHVIWLSSSWMKV